MTRFYFSVEWPHLVGSNSYTIPLGISASLEETVPAVDAVYGIATDFLDGFVLDAPHSKVEPAPLDPPGQFASLEYIGYSPQCLSITQNVRFGPTQVQISDPVGETPVRPVPELDSEIWRTVTQMRGKHEGRSPEIRSEDERI